MTSRRKEIVRVVREVLGPLIRADGGELFIVSVQDNAISLHLAGRFAGCPGNTLTTRRVIEPAILAVAPGVQITVTWGCLLPPNAERVAPPEANATGSDSPNLPTGNHGTSSPNGAGGASFG
ncbi:NifU family protein [Myxococcota bacterium]